MARFIAKYARYRHGVRTGRFMVLQDGQRQELSKDLFCKFETYVPTDEERELGLETFSFLGLPEDRDTNAPVSPRNRISGFDSVVAQRDLDWTDEEREIVETALRNSFAYGDEFIEVTQKAAAKPWPMYDSADPETILTIALSIGADLDEVYRYESENANREEVLKALANPTEEEQDDAVLIEA
jgi:hypothetical protein